MPANKPVRKTPWHKQDPHTAYKFGTEVGRGQYGITSLVTENASGLTYACKVISKHQRGFSLVYVKDEVLALQSVDDHLNIVSVHEVWETSDDVYIFMEACMGGELFDVIISRGHISECDAAVVAGVILRVVAHCHERGVIHRDLKPENFLLKRRHRKGKLVLSEDNLRAVDFGLAAFLSPGKRFRDLVGSAFYVAPEVLKGNYGKEADLWSTGVIIYILLCGLPPFHGPTEKQMFHQIQHAPIDFETDPWPHVSAPAKDLVHWLLQRDPTKRPSAEQALEHAWLAHPPEYTTHIPSSTIVQRLADFTRMTRLQGLLMHVVAHQLTSTDVDSLKELFDEMDKDGNGSISIEELREGLTVVMGADADPAAAEGIMAALDVSGDGEINYSEFIAAVCDHQRMLADHTLAGIFAYMDKNGDGRISANEINGALGESGLAVSESNLEALIAADVPGSDSLAFDDFKALMLGGLKEDAVQYSELESALRHLRQREQVNSRFKRLVLLVVARAMPAEEQIGLKRLFDRLDVDASGQLSLSELRAGLCHINKQLSEQDIFELMHFMDVDSSGQIDFEEFCMGVMDERVLLTTAKLRVAFGYFDKNKDGRIDIAELRQALQQMNLGEGSSASDLLRDAAGEDAEEKGLTFEAFEKMMLAVDHSILPQLPAARQSDPKAPPLPQQLSSSTSRTESLACSSLTDHSSRSFEKREHEGNAEQLHSTFADGLVNGEKLHAHPEGDKELRPKANGTMMSHAVSVTSQTSASLSTPHAPSRTYSREPSDATSHLHTQPCSTSEITPVHEASRVPSFLRRGTKSAKSSPDSKARVSANGGVGSENGIASPRQMLLGTGSRASSGFSTSGAVQGSTSGTGDPRTLDVMKSIDDAWMRSFLV